jgi:hypothetical protein
MPLNIDSNVITDVSVKNYGITSVIRRGLIVNLDPANQNSIDGTSFYDMSFNGNHSVLENGASYSGAGNGSISLDGTNDRISISNASSDFNFGTNNFTLNIWINQSSNSNTYPHLFSLDDQYNFSLKADAPSAATPYRLYVYQDYGVFFPNSYLSPGNWQMITLVREGQQFRLYINSSLTDTVTDSIGPKNISGTTAYLGWGWSVEYTPQLRGPFQAYNTILSATEIAHNYNVTKGRFGL